MDKQTEKKEWVKRLDSFYFRPFWNEDWCDFLVRGLVSPSHHFFLILDMKSFVVHQNSVQVFPKFNILFYMAYLRQLHKRWNFRHTSFILSRRAVAIFTWLTNLRSGAICWMKLSAFLISNLSFMCQGEKCNNSFMGAGMAAANGQCIQIHRSSSVLFKINYIRFMASHIV